MGGRSRQYETDNDEKDKPKISDQWKWLTELSDKRLESYGKMAVNSLRRGEDHVNAKSEPIGDSSRGALYYYTIKEYERRNNGNTPSWKDDNV